MTSPHPWNPNEVTLSEAVSAPLESILTSRISHISEMGRMRHYEYTDPTSDESLLHSINPCLTNFREQLISRSVNETSTQYDPDLEDVSARRTDVSTEGHTQVTAERLADRFCIGPERAKATIRATTQRGIRSAILPIGRRYRADRIFDVRRLNGKFATDTR
jgi:hypothetical protein